MREHSGTEFIDMRERPHEGTTLKIRGSILQRHVGTIFTHMNKLSPFTCRVAGAGHFWKFLAPAPDKFRLRLRLQPKTPAPTGSGNHVHMREQSLSTWENNLHTHEKTISIHMRKLSSSTWGNNLHPHEVTIFIHTRKQSPNTWENNLHPHEV